jgi:hypothetical protein
MESSISQERLEILLALAIASSEKELLSFNSEHNFLSLNAKTNKICENAKSILNSLPQADFDRIANKISHYENWEEKEQNSWKFRILQRIQDRSFWLDKNIHHSHLAKVLENEPLTIQLFILQHLPSDIAHPIAISLGIFQQMKESIKIQKNIKNKKNLFSNIELTTIVREKFLANFVAFEDIFVLEPLEYMSGNDILNIIYQLGVNEIAFACCGIKEIENLATFLRRFSEYTSQLIVDKLARFNKIEKKRISLAEAIIQEWWENANNNTSSLVGLIGFHKLARGLVFSDKQKIAYLKQKISVDLALQLDEDIKTSRIKLNASDENEKVWVEISSNELENISKQIFSESNQDGVLVELNIEEPVYEEIA